MMQCQVKRALLVLLIVPGVACADFWSERIGQAAGATSLLLQPPVAFLSREPAPIMFSGPYDATRLGVAVSYRGDGTGQLHHAASPELERLLSATAVGEYAVSERIGVFGKFGLRYAAGETVSYDGMAESAGRLSHLDHRFGVGVNVRANEVLSLHFEWERYGNGSVAGAAPSTQAWDPWKERNVIGAGVRLGF